MKFTPSLALALIAIFLVLATYFTSAPLIPVAVIVVALAVIFVHARATTAP